MTMRGPLEPPSSTFPREEPFQEELLREFHQFRTDARLHLRSMDSGLSIFRGEANAYQRTFVSAMNWTRYLLLVLVVLHIIAIGLMIYLIAVGS